MPKGYAIHIGLNYVSAKHYNGWDGELGSCVNDAEAMKKVAMKQGFSDPKLLKNEFANLDSVINEIKALAEIAQPEDLVMITYSGHGGQIMDLNNDEPDRNDETWVLYDDELVDDKIFQLLQLFQEDVRVLIISDSCHSGSIFRPYAQGLSPTKDFDYMHQEVAKVKASVRLMAACRDHELAAAGKFLSKYTEAMLKIWDNGNFQGTYSNLNDAILKTQPLKRNPICRTIGSSNEWLIRGRPFEI